MNPGAIERRRTRAGGGGQPVRVAIALADGSDYSLELPEDHPAIADLLACQAPRRGGAPSVPRVLQVPLDAGATALTFSPHHLVRLEVHAPARTLRRARGERKEFSEGNFAFARPGPVQGRTSRNSTGAARSSHDPLTNIDEGHLGGYVRGVPVPIQGSTATPHGDSATWCPLLWQWLIEELGVRSMLDVGCGEGHAAGFFRDAGCDVLGVDGSLLARGESVIPEAHAVHDFVDGPFVPDRSFDLVWSCELVEHVEERFTHNVLGAFASSRKYLLMTLAHPDQPGWHHVNCQRTEYWVDKLGRLDFELDQASTERARELAGRGHFRAQGLMFVRRDERDDASFTPGSASGRIGPTARVDPLPLNPMQVANLAQGAFYLFHDIFVHAAMPKIVAVCSYYGDDWNPAEHDIDYDAVDLVLDGQRFRGRCLRHRLDSWEPCMLLEFEGRELEAAIHDNDEIGFTIEIGKHSRQFTVPTRPFPAFDVAMSLVVRNENRWMRSFLEYYLHCLTAQHVFVYDNGTADRETLLAILEPYRQRGEVTYIPWDFRWRNHTDRKMIAQPAQEAHSLARFANCRWIGFFDVDEFLRLPHTTLPAFLERFAGAAVDGLSFGIRWFSYRGSLGFDEVEEPPLTYLYSRRDEHGRKRQKLFVKGGGTRFLRLHWLEEGKRELPIDDTEIFLHHYEQHPERFEKGKDRPGRRDDYMLRFRDRLSFAEKRPAPATEQEWIEHIVAAVEAAEQCRSQLADEVLSLDGMCGLYTRHFYNNLCNFAGCRFLEIGSYHGASTCAALYANDVTAVCIDNWSEFRGLRGRFEDAVQQFRGRSTVEVIEKNCFEVDSAKLAPFDVFLYDGNHSRESHYLALERFAPTLAEYAVVVIDDWNREPVRQGTREAVRDLGLDVAFEKEIVLAPNETADENREAGRRTWWNGLCVMLVVSRPEIEPFQTAPEKG